MNVVIGWNGRCVQDNFPSVAKRTDVDIIVKDDWGNRMLVNIIQVHCATGHRYYAIDHDDMIDDPFSEDEEPDEGFPDEDDPALD